MNKRKELNKHKEVDYGYVTIHTIPWSEVYYKEKNLGLTPVIGVKLPVGDVKLKFVIRGGEETVYRKIKVIKGEKMNYKIKLK